MRNRIASPLDVIPRTARTCACFAVLIAATTLTASAAQTVLTLDPMRSTVTWRLGALLHTVEGTFALRSGRIVFDSATGGKAEGDVVLDLASGQSGNASRDRKMHDVVLETQRYPEAIFTAERVSGELHATGASALDVAGTVAIHGATKPLTIHVELERNGGAYAARTQFTVPYADWGMKNPSTFILHVDGTVDLDIHALATESPT